MQSCTMLVRREAAEQVGYLDPDFFVYSEEVDFQRRMHDAGWRISTSPPRRAIHHEQLATDRSAGARRVVQFHRGRDDLHAEAPLVARGPRVPRPVGVVVRPRAVAAIFMPGHDPRRYWLHARQALRPAAARGCGRPPRRTTRQLATRQAHPTAGRAQVPARSSSRAATS